MIEVPSSPLFRLLPSRCVLSIFDENGLRDSPSLIREKIYEQQCTDNKMEKQNPVGLPLISVSKEALLDQCFQAMAEKTLAMLLLILSTAAGMFLLNDLQNSAAAMTDPQFFRYFTLILLGVQVAWVASAVVVFLGDRLTETTVKACISISTVSLASVVLALAISGLQGNLVPNFISQPGHLNFGCRSVPSSYVVMHCGEEPCCHTSDCYMRPTMSRLNSSTVCV
ncbi:uncharacterized protein LOC116249625 isoform X2 [Nymphaea colorata]|uniref:uncharacterized protein LOC116249625 isoform X2 n=1 Tax=Nymphaea colorata TaxID=210225 RepID=UPI00129EA25E|nr:uncharacterized protein LOC116249625 isoform X2 [Nymphaea colorata]